MKPFIGSPPASMETYVVDLNAGCDGFFAGFTTAGYTVLAGADRNLDEAPTWKVRLHFRALFLACILTIYR